MSISQTVAYRVCWMRVSNRKYPETCCSCICSVACVRVCASVCVCAHFLNICQSGALYPQKRESRNFFAIFVFVVCLPACLGDFHSITSLVFFSVRWAWLVYFLLFSLVFFLTLLFSGICCLPTYYVLLKRLMRLRARTFLRLFVLSVFFFHLISLQGELPAN